VQCKNITYTKTSSFVLGKGHNHIITDCNITIQINRFTGNARLTNIMPTNKLNLTKHAPISTAH